MDPLQTLLPSIAADITAIKWLAILLLLVGIFNIACMIGLFYWIRRLFRPEAAAEDFREKAKTLLNMNALDRVIRIATERIHTYPGDLFAHWYLGQAYYRKKQWHKALAEFNYIYEIAPSWRQRFVNPFILDIREQLQNTRPEIIKQ
jgi:tetratricopeptide (TPR) repeat protein